MSRAPDRLPNGPCLGPTGVARQPVNSTTPSRLNCAGDRTWLGCFPGAQWQNKLSLDQVLELGRTSKPERKPGERREESQRVIITNSARNLGNCFYENCQMLE